MDYKIINNKPTIVEGNDEYLDLLAHNYKIPRNKLKGKCIIVNKYYVARPDLLSLALYGSDDYADVLCKVNGISNPFELNEDDVLFVPSIDYLDECYNPVNTPCARVKANDTLNKNVENDYRKHLTEKRTANELTVNSQNYIIDKSLGLVFY